MKNIVLTGSIAYDHLLTYDGLFSDVLLAEELDKISLSFSSSSHRSFFGGCAANVAFTLKMLGGEPLVLGVAGNDFERYKNWMNSHGIETKHIAIDTKSPTAVANILTDNKLAQIAVFSPAAMKTYNKDLSLEASEIANVDCALISPEMTFRMVYFAEYFSRVGIPYIFDPGQALSALKKEEIEVILKSAKGVIVNEYEGELLAKIAGRSIEELAEKLEFVVRTLGEGGAELFQDAKIVRIEALKNLELVDPTGCGDAFRAGFVLGYVKKEGLEMCCKMGNVAASYVLETKGTQTHSFDRDSFDKRLASNF